MYLLDYDKLVAEILAKYGDKLSKEQLKEGIAA